MAGVISETSESTSGAVSPSMMQTVDTFLTDLPYVGHEWVEFKLNSKTEKLVQFNNLFGISSALWTFSSPMGSMELPVAVITMISAVLNLVMTRRKRKAETNASALKLEWLGFFIAFVLHTVAFFLGIYLHDLIARTLSVIYHVLAVLLLLLLTIRRTAILCCCRNLTDVRLTVSEKEERRNEMITRARSQGSTSSVGSVAAAV